MKDDGHIVLIAGSRGVGGAEITREEIRDTMHALITAGVVIGGGVVQPYEAVAQQPGAQIPGPAQIVGAGQGSAAHLGGLANPPTIPVASNCASGAIVAGSTDLAGAISTISATTCAIAWANNYTIAPFCAVTDNTTSAALKITTTTSGATISGTTASNTDTVSFICAGR